MDKAIEKTMSALEKNNIHAIYAPTKEDVLREVEKFLFEGCTITSGGSVSLKESGVFDLISKPCYNFIDRSRIGISEEEKLFAHKSVVGSDFYFCSSNAVTENGELINVDGNANRVSAISFGPDKVIMIVGKNKIVPDIKSGFLRVKTVAAPKNCVRLNCDTPCAKSGHCISLDKSDSPEFSEGCSSKQRICAEYLISGFQRIYGRINVILCEENLGF